jgi:hypothetical protein
MVVTRCGTGTGRWYRNDLGERAKFPANPRRIIAESIRGGITNARFLGNRTHRIMNQGAKRIKQREPKHGTLRFG